MDLRPEIEPKLDIAERLYPEILEHIIKYTEYVDEHGDENNLEYKNLENTLHNLTHKDMSTYNLSEYWEEEGAEVLAFRIGLPEPQKVDGITKEEVAEIIRRIGHFEDPGTERNEQTFKQQFSMYLDQYYHDFLKRNFKTYNYSKIFGQQKGKGKQRFWWTDQEKTDMLCTN